MDHCMHAPAGRRSFTVSSDKVTTVHFVTQVPDCSTCCAQTTSPRCMDEPETNGAAQRLQRRSCGGTIPGCNPKFFEPHTKRNSSDSTYLIDYKCFSCRMRYPATGSTFWLTLDPGQRERGYRKGRVKEAESTAATFFAPPFVNAVPASDSNRTLDDLPSPVVSLWPRRDGRSTAGSFPARFDSPGKRMKSSPPQNVSTTSAIHRSGSQSPVATGLLPRTDRAPDPACAARAQCSVRFHLTDHMIFWILGL